MAVVGSGVAGLGAAWALSRRHEVTLFETDNRIGGHANTDSIDDRGRSVPVDTGFIVYNERNYPNLSRLFAHTSTPTEASDMSFAVSVGAGSFEYKGSPMGLLAQPTNLLTSEYRVMVRDVLRFNREAVSLLTSGAEISIGDYLRQHSYAESFIGDFLLPMIGCIWSSKLDEMLSYPATTLVRFLDNHGLLSVGGRPAWRTVTGGSREYLRRVADDFAGTIRQSTPIQKVQSTRDGVRVWSDSGEVGLFDHVVMATHADTTLSILGSDATSKEREILGAFRFQRNRAVLHRDTDFMPARRRVWSSWNYLAENRGAAGRNNDVSLTYWMNKLQNLDTAEPVLVTLNPSREPKKLVSSHDYSHPIYDRAAVDAQHRLHEIQGEGRLWFAGAWTGYGFHEDGLRSGISVAAALGSPAPWSGDIPTLPADRGARRWNPQAVDGRVAG